MIENSTISENMNSSNLSCDLYIPTFKEHVTSKYQTSSLLMLT